MSPFFLGYDFLRAYDAVRSADRQHQVANSRIWPMPDDPKDITWFIGEEHETLLSTRPTDLGDGVRIRTLTQVDGSTEVALIVNPAVTNSVVRDKLWQIKDLASIASIQDDAAYKLVRLRYSRLQNKDDFSSIAKQANDDILFSMCYAIAEEKLGRELQIGSRYAFMLLRAFEWIRGDAFLYLVNGLEDLRENRRPWNGLTAPIDARRARRVCSREITFTHSTEEDKALIALLDAATSQIQNQADPVRTLALEIFEECPFIG